MRTQPSVPTWILTATGERGHHHLPRQGPGFWNILSIPGHAHTFSLQKIWTYVLEQTGPEWLMVWCRKDDRAAGRSSRHSNRRGNSPSLGISQGTEIPVGSLPQPLQEILSLSQDLYTAQSGRFHQAPVDHQPGLSYLCFLIRERKGIKSRHRHEKEFPRHSEKQSKIAKLPRPGPAREGTSICSGCCYL